ncbi:hypothetical protein CAP31_00580 [Sulfuriferula sp. AH1]|uniref:sensor domain-containing protein n=1 Tax=Sulfuriferula sp. AH1 TaxID=1985873 RepID=UPI000B3BA44A|nr:bifunctional diguanylate cyclase/phosphodiesterase [Sulfuriferula sp. AH1]ARU30314.1 hypothetical protein CAP31_00580 [Sulfuriferula sp. AH1]
MTRSSCHSRDDLTSTDGINVWQALFDSVTDPIFVHDADMRIVRANLAYAQYAGMPIGELLGRPYWEVFPKNDGPITSFVHASGTGEQKNGEFTLKSGETFTSSAFPIKDGSGQICYSLHIMKDISSHKRSEIASQLGAQVFLHSTEGMMVTDANNTILAINPAFTRITGYNESDIIGKTPRILHSGQQDKAFYQAMWRALTNEGHWRGEIRNRRKDGEIYTESLVINTIYNPDGTVSRRIALFSNITEKKKLEEQIWHQANFDSLTGLPNRRLFHDRLTQGIKRTHREHAKLALIFLDLDHFKEVNDALGHDMGDTLLSEAARRITSCVRESDTVARMGGDEFTIILPLLNHTGGIDYITENILKQLAEPFALGAEQAFVTASIGIALYPDDASDIESLISKADQAMYAAKNLGRNRSCYFTSALQETAQNRMRLTSDLRAALAGSQFLVYYQPIIELATGNVHKAEALIRWQHPVRGVIAPDEFIPLAEETGMIVTIGDWVFKQAACQVKRLRALHHADFQISVNESLAQFRSDASLFKTWFSHFHELELAEPAIVIEITENLLMDNSSVITDKLLAFRDAGIQVALDDFGTGYSTLSYLKKFHIDYLKIDRMFVNNLEQNADNVALCEAIIVMAHKLRLKVIAEGVETEAQRKILADAGCDYAQGYLFSKPVPAAELEAFLHIAPDLDLDRSGNALA